MATFRGPHVSISTRCRTGSCGVKVRGETPYTDFSLSLADARGWFAPYFLRMYVLSRSRMTFGLSKPRDRPPFMYPASTFLSAGPTQTDLGRGPLVNSETIAMAQTNLPGKRNHLICFIRLCRPSIW